MKPSIISAPATVLLELARVQLDGFIQIQPHTLFSVAEVLEPMHQALIESVFGVKVRQIYQCTEGFLGISNQYGNIQLNEEHLIIEKEWVDTRRFIPIITDLKRTSQPIIRYRLDDVLISAKKKSSAFTEIESIEGREGDICIGLDSHNQQDTPIFADVIRQALARMPVDLVDYQLKQTQKDFFEIATLPLLDSQQKRLIEQNLNQVFQKQNCQCPTWHWQIFEQQSLTMKRRRISCMLGH